MAPSCIVPSGRSGLNFLTPHPPSPKQRDCHPFPWFKKNIQSIFSLSHGTVVHRPLRGIKPQLPRFHGQLPPPLLANKLVSKGDSQRS